MRNPRRSRLSARAFTLVEALCAGVVLAVGALLVSLGASHAYATAQLARDKQQAAEILDEVLTRIDMLGPERLYREGPTEGLLADRYHWSAVIDPQLAGDLYAVTVRIEWTGPRGLTSVSASTQLNDPLGSHPAHLKWEDFE